MGQSFPKTEVWPTSTEEVYRRSIRKQQLHERVRPWWDVNGHLNVSKCKLSRSETRRIRAWTQLMQSQSTTCMTSLKKALKPLIRLSFRTWVQRHRSFTSQRTIPKMTKRSLVSLKTPKAKSDRSANPAMKHHQLSSMVIKEIIQVANRCEWIFKRSNLKLVLR